MKCRLVFVALAAAEGVPLVAFYRSLFGEPTVDRPGLYSEFELPGLKLGIFQPQPQRIDEFRSMSSGSMSLCVEVENLEAAIERMAAIGYPPVGEITSASHGREIYAYDPAGNRLILHEALH